jgi:hypothetical protein
MMTPAIFVRKLLNRQWSTSTGYASTAESSHFGIDRPQSPNPDSPSLGQFDDGMLRPYGAPTVVKASANDCGDWGLWFSSPGALPMRAVGEERWSTRFCISVPLFLARAVGDVLA